MLDLKCRRSRILSTPVVDIDGVEILDTVQQDTLDTGVQDITGVEDTVRDSSEEVNTVRESVMKPVR